VTIVGSTGAIKASTIELDLNGVKTTINNTILPNSAYAGIKVLDDLALCFTAEYPRGFGVFSSTGYLTAELSGGSGPGRLLLYDTAGGGRTVDIGANTGSYVASWVKADTLSAYFSGYNDNSAGQTPLRMGSYYFWVDTSGRLRIKFGQPSSDTDGTVVGVQS